MDIGAQSKSFAIGLEKGLVEEPFDAIRQIAYHTGFSSQPIKPTQIEPEVESSAAFQTGKMVGKVGEFWLINRAVGNVSGLGHLNAFSTKNSEALKMGISGAVSGALTPVNDNNFAREKLAGMVSEGASFAAFGGVTGTAAEFGFLGRPGFRSFWQDAGINAAAGAVSGGVGVNLDSLISKGQIASAEATGSAILQNAIFGAGLAAIDHSLPRAPRTIQATGDGTKSSAYTTEDWSANVYDSKIGDIRSPILTWLANKNLVPKPPKYEELKSLAWKDKDSINLSLSDWMPEQRPAVIQAVRRVAHKDLGQDSNIDAFLGRLTSSENTAAINAYRLTQEPVLNKASKIQDLMSVNPAFKDMSLQQVLYDRSVEPLLNQPENAALQKALTEYSKVSQSARWTPEKTTADQKLTAEINGLASDIGIPPVNSVYVSASRHGQTIGKHLEVGLGDSPKVDSATAENIYHEFVHHSQGPLYGKESIAYLAKFPFYGLLERVGLIKEIPMKQQTGGSRENYIGAYIGSDQEKQAWATGLLVRIRAIAAGLPNVQW